MANPTIHRAGAEDEAPWVVFDEPCEELLREGVRLAFDLRDGTAPKSPKQPRVRRPSLEIRARQLWKAAQAVDLQIAVTVEGDKVTATPTRSSAAEPRSETPGRALFQTRAAPKVKVVF
jgi:hypothetical protein